MILQEEFQKSGYHDLLVDDNDSKYGIDLEDIYEVAKQPAELLGIFISGHGDELFFLLNGDWKETDSQGGPKTVSELCDQWDERIRIFAIINGNRDTFKKLKFNIVQLIVYSGEAPDRSREGDLQITRKIIIKGELKDQAHIVIDDDEAIELPFHMIPPDAFAPDAERTAKLQRLLPADQELLGMMKKRHRRVQRREDQLVQPKSLKAEDYEQIKGWLET